MLDQDFYTCLQASFGLNVWTTIQLQKLLEGMNSITDVSPLSMMSLSGSFNIATNVSFKSELYGLCGLSHGDVYVALELPGLCGSDIPKIQKHFDIMERYFDGYHFCRYGKVPLVFNTNTCLEYLQVSNHMPLFH